jgi:large subunit ribosomal protein L35
MTRKSVSKRFKITKTGKVTRRKMGLSHFRAKKSGKEIKNKKSLVKVDKATIKILKKYL